MVEVVIMKTIEDVVDLYGPHHEQHPAFKVLWNQCGFAARVDYAIQNRTSMLLSEVAAEVEDLRARAAATPNKEAWQYVVDAIDKFDRASGLRLERDEAV